MRESIAISSKKLKSSDKKAITMLLIMIVMIVISMIISPTFRSTTNLLNILNQNAIYGVMAFGMGVCILTGAIDLSAGSVAALAGVVATPLFRDYGLVAGLIGGLGIGALIGLVNGVLVTKVKVTYFVTTLGMMSVARGAVFIITNGIPIQGVPREYNVIGMGKIAGSIPTAALIWFLCGIAMYLILKFTRFGQQIYAVGGSERAAWLSGVNTDRIRIAAFTICGFFSALGGLLLNTRVLMATSDAADGYELTVIAACIIGGISMDGGEGNILSTIVGTIIMGLILNMLQLLGISSFWTDAVTGAIIIGAVAIDSLSSKKRE